MVNIKMNNLWIIAIIILLAFFMQGTKKLAGETLQREFSSTFVNPGQSFTLRYNVQNPDPPFFFSVKDDVTAGGCTIFGSSAIVTTVTSPSVFSEITIDAPGVAGTDCTFIGDWKLGSDAEVAFGAPNSIRVCNQVNCVQSGWTPLENTACPGFGFTQTRAITTPPDCGGNACSSASQGATGSKDCGTTVSLNAVDDFPNGCNGGLAGTCNSCFTYGDGFDGVCSKNINLCSGGVSRSELGCVAQEWIVAGGTEPLRTFLGDSAQDWMNNGGP